MIVLLDMSIKALPRNLCVYVFKDDCKRFISNVILLESLVMVRL